MDFKKKRNLRKYYFLFETLAGYAILVAIDLSLLEHSAAFEAVHPHPYWIVILLIASRYGTLQGVFAGGIGAVSYIALRSHFSGIDFSLHQFPHGPYAYPFFFLLVGGVIGEIRSMYKKKFDRLEQKYFETRDDLKDLGLMHGALTESKQELEKRIAFQSTTMLNLIQRFNTMETLELNELYQKTLELLEEQLNVTCSSVYVVDQKQLKLLKRYGEKQENALPEFVEIDYGIMGEVITSKKIVTVNQEHLPDDPKKFQSSAVIMSAPIKRKDDSVIALINVEEIPFFDFTANTIRIFETICAWISLVADKSLQFKQLRDRNIDDEITGAYNYLYFQKRLSYEIARATRFHAPVSLVLLKINRFEDMQDKQKKNVLVVLNWLFSNLLRQTDIIFKYKTDDTFAVILPHQTASEAELIVSRLLAEVENFKIKPFEGRDELLSISVGLSSLQLSEGSEESLLRSAEERMEVPDTRETDVFSDITYLLQESSG